MIGVTTASPGRGTKKCREINLLMSTISAKLEWSAIFRMKDVMNVIRYPQLGRLGPKRKCEIKASAMCMPFVNTKRMNSHHVGKVQRRGLADVGGGRRWRSFGSTRDDGGRGDGVRKG